MRMRFINNQNTRNRMALDKNFIYYSFCTFASNIMSSVFSFYYVYFFLDVYKVSHSCFQFAQVLFMVWNAINDPLFGWIQDHSSSKWILSRQLNILYGAPVFAVSFLFGWFPFYDVLHLDSEYWKCIHLVLTLCFWDTMFSFVLLAYCALFTEVTTDHTSRVRLTQYTRVAAICGFWAVPMVEYGYETYGNEGFYLCLFFIAIVATIFMCLTGLFTRSNVNRLDDAQIAEDPPFFSYEFLRMNLQIVFNKNFISFVTMNFLSAGMCHFAASFTKIFTEDLSLFSDSKSNKLTFFFINSVGGNLLIVLISPFIESYGSVVIVCLSFVSVFLSSVLLYFWRTFNTIIVQILILNIVPSGMFGLYNIFVSSVIDEDQVRYKRKLPLSSMIFGINALITKPAQSIFPMIAAYFLDMTKVDVVDAAGNPTKEHPQRSREAIVTLLCVLPMVTALLQLLVFCPFRMTHLSEQLRKNTAFNRDQSRTESNL